MRPFILLLIFSSLINVTSNFVGSFSILSISVPNALCARFVDVIAENKLFLMPPGVVNVILSIE